MRRVADEMPECSCHSGVFNSMAVRAWIESESPAVKISRSRVLVVMLMFVLLSFLWFLLLKRSANGLSITWRPAERKRQYRDMEPQLLGA